MAQHDWQTLGARLRAAREAAGFTQAEAAEVLGVSRSTLSQIEAGRTRLDSLSLRQLADLYRRPIDSFFDVPVSTAPAASPLSATDVTRLDELVLAHFTDRPARDRRVIGRFLRFCQDLAALRAWLGRPRREPPDAYPLGPRARKFAAEGVAVQERARLGLHDAPVGGRLFELVEEIGVPIYRAPLAEEGISGLLVHHPTAGPVIFVNAQQYPWRQVFTVAHEYGHLLLHARSQPVACCIFGADGVGGGDATGEALVNAFASEFLMPEDGVKRFLLEAGATSDKLTVEQVVRLQRHFGVSFKAMLYRLQRLRLLPEAEVRRMSEEARPVAVAWRLGYALDPDELVEVGHEGGADDHERGRLGRFPHEYVALTFGALDRGLISNGRASELLDLNRGAFDRLYRAIQRRARDEAQEQGLEHVVA